MTLLGLLLCFLSSFLPPIFPFSLLQVPFQLSTYSSLPTKFLFSSKIQDLAMTSMQPIPTEVSEWRLRVANVVHDVFSSLFSSNRSSRTSENGESGDKTTTRGSRGLETSRWAPQNANASANVSKTNANRSNTRVSSGRRLEDSRWAPKQVVQRSGPAVRRLEDSTWASKVDTKKDSEVKVRCLYFPFFYKLSNYCSP